MSVEFKSHIIPYAELALMLCPITGVIKMLYTHCHIGSMRLKKEGTLYILHNLYINDW